MNFDVANVDEQNSFQLVATFQSINAGFSQFVQVNAGLLNLLEVCGGDQSLLDHAVAQLEAFEYDTEDDQ